MMGVVSKNTNELKIRVPGRFGLEVASCYVSTIGKAHEYFDLTGTVLALFAVGDVYVSLCKKIAYAPFARGEGRERYFGCNYHR